MPCQFVVLHHLKYQEVLFLSRFILSQTPFAAGFRLVAVFLISARPVTLSMLVRAENSCDLLCSSINFLMTNQISVNLFPRCSSRVSSWQMAKTSTICFAYLASITMAIVNYLPQLRVEVFVCPL